jgi:hypothetical protein
MSPNSELSISYKRPLDDQGVFIPIIVRDDTRDLKSHLGIKCLSSVIASSHLRPYLCKMGGLHRPLEESGRNALSSMLEVDSDRDDMPVPREDDISKNFLISVMVCIDTNQKGFRIEVVKVEEGGPIVR